MATGQITSAWNPENFIRTTLSADITSSATDIFLTSVPTETEGTLVIDPDSVANREIIYYNSKTGTKVVCPSAALGRGYDGTTATSHTSGTVVIMAPVADWFRSLKTLFTTTPQGWSDLGATPDTITANGNRSYDLVFNSNDLTDTVSNGMRLKLTRTVTAPTQCTDLEASSSQYYSRASGSITGMSFTDDWSVSAWIKVESYVADQAIVSRISSAQGWWFGLDSSGRVVLSGHNAALGNYRRVRSYQSIPLNKWVHVSAQMDMSGFTTATCKVMIDGVDVPAEPLTSGTNPTTLVQAGDLQVGGGTAGGLGYFDGKIAQLAIYSAIVAQATIKASMSQTLSGSETSLISAYSFNNVLTDLNANANTLTANGSAVATATDTPFAGGSVGTTEYGIITANTFSTNTTLTVQVPEGYAIPTSGGVSAVSYSTQSTPYGFPRDSGKWRVLSEFKTSSSVTSNATYGSFQSAGWQLVVPIGSWKVGQSCGGYYNVTTTAVDFRISPTALTGLTLTQGANLTGVGVRTLSPSAAAYTLAADVSTYQINTASSTWVMYTLGGTTSAGIDGSIEQASIYAECAYL